MGTPYCLYPIKQKYVFIKAKFLIARSSEQLIALIGKGGDVVLRKLPCKKSSHVHGQVMGEAQEKQGGNFL